MAPDQCFSNRLAELNIVQLKQTSFNASSQRVTMLHCVNAMYPNVNELNAG